MGPLQGSPSPRAYCMGSEVQMALQDVAARTDVGELTQTSRLLPSAGSLNAWKSLDSFQ